MQWTCSVLFIAVLRTVHSTLRFRAQASLVLTQELARYDFNNCPSYFSIPTEFFQQGSSSKFCMTFYVSATRRILPDVLVPTINE
jgi:hypothetical protein